MSVTRKSFLALLFLLLPVVGSADLLEDSKEMLGQVALHGFFDSRSGIKTQWDEANRQTNLLEGRLQLEGLYQGETISWQLRGDLVADFAASTQKVDLDLGTGFIDLRDANLIWTPRDWLDLKIGRQIITWGTGDLLFLNDLFPKDWVSFLIGRDEEYLKAPSDALMASFFSKWANLDLVYTPRFDHDRYISGERVTYYNPVLGGVTGRSDPLTVDTPTGWFSDDELALRISHNVSGYEAAFYSYFGFWKSPVGYDPAGEVNTFPNLNVYGASLRTSLLGGIGNIEGAYYDSSQDRNGSDPYIPNSEYRLLLGYEREVVKEFTLAAQYYLEYMENYRVYEANLPEAAIKRDQARHLLTLRLTQLLLNQNLNLSLFAFYSPSDADYYLRPQVSYKVTDDWKVSCGANLFGGQDVHTFFRQYQNNSNVYAAVRYSF